MIINPARRKFFTSIFFLTLTLIHKKIEMLNQVKLNYCKTILLYSCYLLHVFLNIINHIHNLFKKNPLFLEPFLFFSGINQLKYVNLSKVHDLFGVCMYSNCSGHCARCPIFGAAASVRTLTWIVFLFDQVISENDCFCECFVKWKRREKSYLARNATKWA